MLFYIGKSLIKISRFSIILHWNSLKKKAEKFSKKLKHIILQYCRIVKIN